VIAAGYHISGYFPELPPTPAPSGYLPEPIVVPPKRAPSAPAAPRGPKRKYERFRVGDRCGRRTIVAILTPDATSNERVEWLCDCGARGRSRAYNVRTAAAQQAARSIDRCIHRGRRP
jgi:hypothetical protein